MSIYEEIEIEDLDYDASKQIYTYPCPCGDKFSITLDELWDGEDIATCPSCTLRIMIIYEEEDLPELLESDDEDEAEEEEEERKSSKDGGDAEKKSKEDKDKSTGEEEKKEDDGDDDELAKSTQKKLSV